MLDPDTGEITAGDCVFVQVNLGRPVVATPDPPEGGRGKAVGREPSWRNGKMYNDCWDRPLYNWPAYDRDGRRTASRSFRFSRRTGRITIGSMAKAPARGLCW